MTNLGTIGMNMPSREAPDEIWTCSNGRGDGDPSDPDDISYLRATEARRYAEFLARSLQEAIDELDAFYQEQYTDDHPHRQRMIERARGPWDHARRILARIEGEK